MTGRELMVCPFCRSTAIHGSHTASGGVILYNIRCRCGAGVNDFFSRAEAAAAWNTRQPAGNNSLAYAKRLATVLWRDHYAEDAPQWEVMDDLYGALSQIDNMICGLQKKEDKGGEAVSEIVPKFVGTTIVAKVLDDDRQMLMDVHQELQTCTHECERCGESDPLNTFDVAIMLKDYLNAAPRASDGDARDAARYRWLRDSERLRIEIDGYTACWEGEELDAMLDVSIAKRGDGES